jgi:hypothetical protein
LSIDVEEEQEEDDDDELSVFYPLSVIVLGTQN